MKRIVPVIFSVSLLIVSCDKNEISDSQKQAFIKYFGSESIDKGMKVITTDEGYLIMGNIQNPGNNTDICIIRTDKFGNSLGPIKVCGGTWDDFGYAIKPANTQGFVIVGSTQKTEFGDKDIYIVRIDEEGDTMWTASYDGSMGYDDVAYDVIVLGNDHLVLTGYSENSENGKINKDLLFFETGEQGDSLYFNHGGINEDEVAFSIIQSDPDYLFAGYYSYWDFTTQSYIKSIVAFRWSGVGGPKPYKHPVGLSSEAVSIKSAGNDEYYLLCNVLPEQSNESLIYLLRMNAVGNYLLEKRLGERPVNIGEAMAITDNSIIICGTAALTGNSAFNNERTGDMLILKTDLSGNNPVYYYVGDGISYVTGDFDLTPDGGYILTGANYINSNRSFITLCKLDSEGNLR